MIDQIFFDTDCISSFLWVKKEEILLNLYPKKIILSQQVFDELSNPRIPHLKSRIEELKNIGDISVISLMLGTEEFQIYYNLINPPAGQIVLGKGEASVLALAKVTNGIVASNNLKDINQFIKYYKLRHLTTGKIMIAALEQQLIDENEGNQIWENMIKRRRLLPTATFTAYINFQNQQ